MAYNLKSEEDVKEFLKNLLIEYKFGCYSEMKGEVCHLLGDYHEAISRDFKTAADLYKSTCDHLQFNRSCTKFGGYSVLGKSVELNKDVAYEYMKKGCDLNDPIGCANAGILALTNLDFNIKSKEEPLKMLDTACNNKIEKACFFLSSLYLKGNPEKDQRFRITKDMKKSFNYSLKACELGNFYACHNVSKMYSAGHGTKQSEELSKKYKNIAADLERDYKTNQSEVRFGMGTEK